MMDLLNALPKGQKNAVTRAELRELTGLSDRALRRELHTLRTSGQIICSSTIPPGGYWRPDSAQEIAAFLGSMDRRARSVFAATSSARRLLDDFIEAYQA